VHYVNEKTWLAELRIGLLRQKTTGTVFAFMVVCRMACHQSFLAHDQRTQANCPNFILHFTLSLISKTPALAEHFRWAICLILS